MIDKKLENSYLSKLKKQFNFDKLINISTYIYKVYVGDEIFRCFVKNDELVDTSYRNLSFEEINILKQLYPNYNYTNDFAPYAKSSNFPNYHMETTDFIIFRDQKYKNTIEQSNLKLYSDKIIKLFKNLELDGYAISVNINNLVIDIDDNVLCINPFIYIESNIPFKILYNIVSGNITEYIIIEGYDNFNKLSNEELLYLFNLISKDDCKIVDILDYSLSDKTLKIKKILLES